ncbi:hypothetical protein NPX13_g9773 [Xylaria arbuscula]|uniref:Uncharacterized protein n=1 Tax=Xylaria arbuscula TaxID=114810 RepID=A0A9W8N620_9PEZI|nr:hypothetical protein NPX13_g9773 [Xylaria arbuscula]
MSPVLRLLVRITEGGLHPRDLGGDFVYHHNRPRDNDGDSDGNGGLPWYAILLIVYFSILFLVFWSSLVYFYTRDNERRNGQPVRVGHIVLKALTVASGVGVWIWFFQKRGWLSDREENKTSAVGPYEKIKTRRTPAPIGVGSSAGSPSGSSILPASPHTTSAWPSSPNTPTTWHGTQTTQNATYAPYEQSNDMYKSPGYNPNSTLKVSGQHESIPMITLSPSPSTSPAPMPSPNMNPSYAPPPYVSTPPPAALYGQKFPPQNNQYPY